MSKIDDILAAAAAVFATALDLAVPVSPASTQEPDVDGDSVQVVAALARGATTINAETLGGAERYELQHEARLELLAAGGPEAARAARVAALWPLAGAAIAADPSLGGLVDHAELDPADDEGAAEATLRGFAGGAATLRVLYTAAHPNA